MKILIVGGTSSIGQALFPILSEFAEVLTAGRGDDVDVQLDLRNSAEEMVLPNDIDVVINAAAGFGGKDFQEIFDTENVNVMGVLKLCKACTNAQVKRLVLISSIFASLDSTSQFFSAYALSKKHSEELARLYSSMFGLPLTILRPSQFYGTGKANRKHQPFLSTIIDRAANDEDIFIYGTHDALRNFIHVEDVAKIVALVVQRRIDGLFSCAYPKNVSYSEISRAAIEAFNSKSTLRFLRDRPDIPDNIFELDDSLFQLIDYWPQISIQLGMKKEAAYRKAVQ